MTTTKHDSALASVDPDIARLVSDEEQRQSDKIRLIPSENYVSKAVLEATGSVLTNKYSEGYAGKRYYEGNQLIDEVETLAVERAKALFGVDHANVLCVGQRATGDAVAMKILDIWMSTPFDGGRHTARIENITALEERLKKEYS